MAIKNTSFAKGEAVQKLIEVIARVNNKSVSDDAALQVAIDEVREMFKTDELTECTTAELNTFISGSQLEPGHKYKITDNDNIIVSAKSTSELESYAIGDTQAYRVMLDRMAPEFRFIHPDGIQFGEQSGDDSMVSDGINAELMQAIIDSNNIVEIDSLEFTDNFNNALNIPAGQYYDGISENGSYRILIKTDDSFYELYPAYKEVYIVGYANPGGAMLQYYPTKNLGTYYFRAIEPSLPEATFNDFAYNVAEGDTYTPLQKIILETVGDTGASNLVEVDAKEFALKVTNGGFEPGTVYKCDFVRIPKYVGGEEAGYVECVAAVMAVSADKLSPDMILIDGESMFAVTGSISNPLGDTGPAYLEIESFVDGNGNRTNFYPGLYFPDATTFSRNNIIFNKINGHISAPADFACSATTVVGNTIISPSKFTVSATTVQANEVAIGAQVVISGAGTVGMNKFGAASNVNVACVSNCDVTYNEFGDSCAVTGTSLQVFQMNKVGAGSTGIQFSVMAAGNEIAYNCSDIKIAIGQRNKFGVQCGNISLNGTTYGCSGNEFANGCGAEGAITLADGCGGNTFGIQCCSCTLNANVVGCEFEGFNKVNVAAGLQNYSVKKMVGYAKGVQNVTLYKGYTNGAFRVNVSHDTKGNLIYWTDDEALAGGTDEFIGTNTVSTIANIPVTKSTVLANLTAGGTVSFVSGLAAGREVFVVAKNTSDAEIELKFPSSANVDTLKVAAGSRAEFSLVSLGGTYHIRVAEDIEIPEADTFIGSNSVVTIENIPVDKSTVVATVTVGGEVSFAEGLTDGREVYVIAQNAGTVPITLTFADANVESVTLANGERAEFSVINIAGTYYTRVGVDAAAADVEEISAEEVAAKFA